MPDVKTLCLDAAKMACPADPDAAMRPAILGSADGQALTVLTRDAPMNLRPADVASALASFPWILHVRACTVGKWHLPDATDAGPAVGVVADCYSPSGQWQLVLGSPQGGLQSPVVFREVLEVHPLSAWQFSNDGDNRESGDDSDWAQRAYQQRTEPERTPIEVLEAQIAHNELRMSDAINRKELALHFSQIVAFDFSKHSAAGDLEALGRLASGLSSPAELLARLANDIDRLRAAHCKSLLERLSAKLSRTAATKVAGILEQPAADALKLLAGSGSLPEARGLAYWLTSYDFSEDGVSLTDLAKAFKVSAKAFEDGLTETPMRISCACPVCASDAPCDVQRAAPNAELLTFSMRCGVCGHQEALLRKGTWLRGPMTCSCAVCVKRQREATAMHLPRVVIALEDALRAAPGLAAKVLRATVKRLTPAGHEWSSRLPKVEYPANPSEWDNLHEVYLRMDRTDEPVPVHHFKPSKDLGPVWGATVDETVHAVASLGPTNVEYLEKQPEVGEEVSESFAYFPGCIGLLLEGDSLAPSDVLPEWAKALQVSGLLWPNRSNFSPLVMMPYGWLTCEFSSVRQREIQLQKDLVVWRRVPQAEALLVSLRDTLIEEGESSAYGKIVVATGYANAPKHGKRLLEEAQSLPAPEAHAALQQLAMGQTVPVEAVRAARDALKRDRAASALFYATLLWNYSPRGTGVKSLLNGAKLAVFSGKTVDLAREKYALKIPIACRRCACENASLTFWGANDGRGAWRVDCEQCGHWEKYREFSREYPTVYCNCQHCANAVSVALEGKSTASLMSELVTHCVVEAQALSSKSASTAISDEATLSDLLEDVKYDKEQAAWVKQHASKATWKSLRFHTGAGLLRHVLPGYSFDMPSMQALALLAENRSPTMSPPIFRALQSILPLTRTYYQDEHLRFRLPLCVVLPEGLEEPKILKRRARQANDLAP